MQENTDIYESYVNHEMIAVELALYLSEINGLDLKTESETSNFFKHAMCLSDNFIRLVRFFYNNIDLDFSNCTPEKTKEIEEIVAECRHIMFIESKKYKQNFDYIEDFWNNTAEGFIQYSTLIHLKPNELKTAILQSWTFAICDSDL